MPHFAASDLDLHRLSMSHKKEARLIWIGLYGLALCIAMDFPIHIDTMSMGLPSAYCVILGVTGRIFKF